MSDCGDPVRCVDVVTEDGAAHVARAEKAEHDKADALQLAESADAAYREAVRANERLRGERDEARAEVERLRSNDKEGG